MPIGNYKFTGSPLGPVEIRMSAERGTFNGNDPKYRVVCNQVHCTVLLHILIWLLYILSAYMFCDGLVGFFTEWQNDRETTLILFLLTFVLLSVTFLMHAALLSQNWMFMIPALVVQAVNCVLLTSVTFVYLAAVIAHVVFEFNIRNVNAHLGSWTGLLVVTCIELVNVWIFDILVASAVYYRDKKANTKVTNTSQFLVTKPSTTTTVGPNEDALGRIYLRRI